MAEYISREAALRVLCDACGNAACPKGLIPRCSYYEKMQSIPAADVRPVVLCKDCKYFSEVMYKGTQFEYGYCDRWADGTRMDPEDFCSRAAKREES